MTMLEVALAYAGRGWPVLAISPRDKIPLGKLCPHGLKDATTDEATIRHWWTAQPDANIGLATGRMAGFWVLDVDTDHGGADSLAELERQFGDLPDTVESLTGGGGRHLLFAWPVGVVVRNRASLAPGLDVRGEGGYIVAPPSMHHSGWEYAWELSSDPNDGVAIADAPGWLLGLIVRANLEPKPGQAPAIDGEILEGRRNATLASLAGAMRRQGAAPDEILVALQAVNARRCRPPLDDAELRRIATSIGRYAPAPEAEAGPEFEPVPAVEMPTPPQEPPEPAHLTDLGNAKRLVTLHGADMRYCHLWGKWLVWEGRRWVPDTSGAVERLAKATVQEFYAEAARTEDDERRKVLARHALKSEGQRSILAMLALAQSEEGIPVQPQDLDANPWLLNVLNGTIDLRTGELQPHRREDLITKLAPVEYDPEAELELWDRFLDESAGGDRELVTFLQRAAGYSLTGETDEEKLFFVHGPAAAGKSTFLEALKATLGDYAETADFETFLARSYVGGPRNDVARLAGARLVVGIEVDEGKKLAESLVKTITGGDTVAARFMYKEAFVFRPQFKLWLAANHAPRVHDDDEAMWRRILRVPFEHAIPPERRDPRLKAALRDPELAGPAILAWAVRGCLAWQERGLGIPPVVQQATEAYRLDNDPLRDFIASCCVLEPTRTVTVAQLNEEYDNWCKDNREQSIKSREFKTRIEIRGCRQEKTTGGRRIWVGIGLVCNENEMPPNSGKSGISGTVFRKPLREAETSSTFPKMTPILPLLPLEGENDAPASGPPEPDPTDRGLWQPPADVRQMMEEMLDDG